MGKTLSILAITTQVYNINGWSIYPPHLALGEDDELPTSMEHLRPYLRKRSGPIRAPPGLQHNQRYYPKSIQSRQLLMQRSSSSVSSTLLSPDPVEYAMSLMDDFLYQQESSVSDAEMDALKKLYQEHKFRGRIIKYMNKIRIPERNQDKHEGDKTMIMENLNRLISVQHKTINSDKDKLMITMESLSIGNFKYPLGSNGLWMYSILYSELYGEAVKHKLVPSLHEVEHYRIDTSKYPDSGIMILLDNQIPWKLLPNACTQSSQYYIDFIVRKISGIDSNINFHI